jgi:predicted amidohydrolase YtcJ
MKTLYTNAVIYSPSRLKADSLAVANGKIFDIGLKTKLISLKRHGFKVVDLKKKTVLPGFIDSHVHLLTTGYNIFNVNLYNVNSLDKALMVIQKAVKGSARGQWVLGGGWDKNLWGIDFPDKTILDKIAPKNPVRLFSKDGHSIWVNSEALDLCGIDETTSDPAGGTIMRYPDDKPTGILQENAIEMITGKIPEPTLDFKQKALKKAIKRFNSLGITGVADCDWHADRLNLFSDIKEKGFLSLRVFMMLAPGDVDSAVALGLKTGYGDDIITLGSLKLYMDGSLGSQSAWMFSPYENQPTNKGIRALSDDELDMYFEKTHIKNISLAVHAIGDQANAEALTFFARKQAVSKKLKLSHRIEHAQLLRKSDISRFRKFNVAASMQPVHIIADRDLADKYWGRRAKLAYAVNSLLESGAAVGFGSDAPIEDPNPMLGIYAAIARKKPGDDRPGWYPEQAIKLPRAIEAYTRGSAHICSWADKAGELKPGAYADFAVVSEDIFKIKQDQIPGVKALATIFNGEIVYSDKNFKL